jgi:hypothetical protein
VKAEKMDVIKETLDEWIGKNAFGLGCEIATHLKVYGLVEDDCESCLRVIFTSIRQWSEQKKLK